MDVLGRLPHTKAKEGAAKDEEEWKSPPSPWVVGRYLGIVFIWHNAIVTDVQV
jgi:hypothetical protein